MIKASEKWKKKLPKSFIELKYRARIGLNRCFEAAKVAGEYSKKGENQLEEAKKQSKILREIAKSRVIREENKQEQE